MRAKMCAKIQIQADISPIMAAFVPEYNLRKAGLIRWIKKGGPVMGPPFGITTG